MNRDPIRKLLADAGAIITGSHIVYKSGKHGDAYVNKDALYVNPAATFEVSKEMAHLASARCRELGLTEIAVVAPAVGGVALSQWTTYYLCQLGVKAIALYADKAEVAFVLSENDDEQRKVLVKVDGKWVNVPDKAAMSYSTGEFVLKRGYDKLVAGKKVLAVEDVLTTGGSLKASVAAIRAAGGDPFMAVALCNRGGVTAEAIGVPSLESLLDIRLEMHDEDACPLCAAGVSINTSVGHGKAYLARKGALQPA